MPNQFNKFWIAAMLIATMPTFAEPKDTDTCHLCEDAKTCPPYEQGHETSSSEMHSGYNAPACIQVKDSWDVYLTGSFIYWQARQDNMEIGMISRNDPEGLIAAADDPFETSYVNNMSITSPNFTFHPGFKVGVGADLSWDHWSAYAEYTWFHGSIGTGVRPLPRSTATTGRPNGQYLYSIQGTPGAFDDLFFKNGSQSWTLKMDFLDVSLARDYYMGTKFTIRPFFGARGAWIRQYLTTSYAGSSLYTASDGFHNAKVSNQFASWGVGPRLGLESNWMLGYGARFIGDASVDILYTRYSIHFNQQVAQFAGIGPATNPISSNASVSQEIDLLRTHLDIEMGLGWGMYLWDQSYHIDLSATYGFQVFWDQNMCRNFTDDVMQAKSNIPNGNLYIHGLTANARFDF